MSPIPRLSGRQIGAFADALADAYAPTDLEMMLRYRLDKRLSSEAPMVSPTITYPYVCFKLVERADQRGWAYALLMAARQSAPENSNLLAFAQELGLATEVAHHTDELAEVKLDTSSLQAILADSGLQFDVDLWRQKLGEVEGRVCRVEVAGMPRGTGFLLGSSAVVTNYHVVEPVIGGQRQPGDIVLRFDYRRLPDGTTLNPGKEYKLAAGPAWLIDGKPYSQVDLEPDPKSGPPEPDRLDYALLRVDGTPGDDPLGEKAEPGAPKRGWIEVPTTPPALTPGGPVFILQHPEGAPLKLAVDPILAVEGEGRRVRYRTATEHGSSGSPVFSSGWELLALHHSGDPSSKLPKYNEGIPFNLIRDQIGSGGFGSFLGAHPA